MAIKNINKLFTGGKYQKALIEYMFYAIDNKVMAEFAIFNAKFSQSKLQDKLVSYCVDEIADKSSAVGDDCVFNLPLILNLNDSQDSGVSWYRLDFVVSGNDINGDNELEIPLTWVDGEKIVLNIDFDIRTINSVLFKYPSGVGGEDAFEGAQCLGNLNIGYSIQKIDSSILVSQFIFEVARYFAVEINQVVNRFNDYRDLNVIFGDEFDRRYFKTLFAKSNATGVIENKYIESLVNDIKSCFNFNQIVDSKSDLSFGFSDDNAVQYKHGLGDAVNFNIEGVKAIGSMVVMHGWIVDPKHNINSIKLIDKAANISHELIDKLVRFERLDVLEAFSLDSSNGPNGFAVVIEVPKQVIESNENMLLYLSSKNGKFYTESISKTKLDIDNNGLMYLMGVLPDQEINAERCRKFYKPIFNTFCLMAPKIEEVFDHTYNKLDNEVPLLSIIIPLYGQTRFELTQIPVIAALKFHNIELILAVDDPQILSDVRINAERLSALYGLSVRVVAPDKNLGFSGINNFAAERAKGDLILFLNSDCFITQIEPLHKAIRWLQNKAHGAVGFRLMFADNTIQHDGMSISKWNNSSDFYLNDHPLSGTPINLMSSSLDNDSSMITAACVMIKKHAFFEIGGFNRAYLRGDFEDSDLCLKLLAKRKKLGIVREEGIYHLERQTISGQEPGLRQKITLINSYIYSQRWKTILSKKLPMLEVVL